MSPGGKRGRFVVLEGIDGSGTTTAARGLVEQLTGAGRDVLLTCEPSAGPVGRFIRQALEGRLEGGTGDHPSRLGWASMALLFAADRLDHLEREVLPALERGAVVVSDRYDLSSIAYQSATSPDGDAAIPWLRSLNARARRPDLTLVFDVDPAVAAARRRARGGLPELFEQDALQARLAGLYARAEELLPGDRMVHVDAGAEADAVLSAVLAALEELG